jgi:hypothetical protein
VITPIERLANPDLVGAAEYRAIHETIVQALDGAAESEQLILALGILSQFEEHARAMRRALSDTTVKFPYGTRVRVVSYPSKRWIGNTGTIVGVPGDPVSTHDGRIYGPATAYAMTFDGVAETFFAPFHEDQLEALD